MLLLLFTPSAGGPVVIPSGHPGRSRGRGQGFLPLDDDQALQMLLDAEDADILNALHAYETALRRLL